MLWQWLENFLHRWQGEWDAEKILIAVLAAAMATVIIKILILVLRWASRHVKELLDVRRRLKHALWAVSEESPGIWLSKAPSFPPQYIAHLDTSMPIITIANLKGGLVKQQSPQTLQLITPIKESVFSSLISTFKAPPQP